MSSPNHSVTSPRTLALFQKRIAGDDSLLQLAQLRFEQAGLGAEFYAGTPDELERLWAFRPLMRPEAPVSVHLDRDLNVFEERGRKLVLDFATRFRGRLWGMVAHDRCEMTRRDYVLAIRELAFRLEEMPDSPRLFVEYAAGLEPAQFAEFFERTRELERISPCIDVGHVGIRTVRHAYSRAHPGEDVCTLNLRDQLLPEVIADVQEAVGSALDVVLELIGALGKLKKPLHFHLHDGHPLWACSRAGLSDHMSFLNRVPIPLEHDSKRALDPMFGPSGLFKIITRSLEALGADCLSFTLEVQPTEGRIPLGDAAYLVGHWRDTSNAERMNYWLSVLAENHQLVASALQTPLRNQEY